MKAILSLVAAVLPGFAWGAPNPQSYNQPEYEVPPVALNQEAPSLVTAYAGVTEQSTFKQFARGERAKGTEIWEVQVVGPCRWDIFTYKAKLAFAYDKVKGDIKGKQSELRMLMKMGGGDLSLGRWMLGIENDKQLEDLKKGVQVELDGHAAKLKELEAEAVQKKLIDGQKGENLDTLRGSIRGGKDYTVDCAKPSNKL